MKVKLKTSLNSKTKFKVTSKKFMISKLKKIKIKLIKRMQLINKSCNLKHMMNYNFQMSLKELKKINRQRIKEHLVMNFTRR